MNSLHTEISQHQDHSKPSETKDINVEKYKNKIILDVELDIILSKPKVSWSDIVGQERAKRVLQENIILPILFPQLFVGGRPAFGTWLYGPSGTGKRLLVHACANEIDSPVFVLEAQDLLLRGPQKASEKIKKTFAAAKAAAPSILYIDDIVSLFPSSGTPKFSEAWRNFKSDFSIERYGLIGSSVIILASSQKPWLLDSYIRRKTTERRIYMSLPEESARKELINKQLNTSGFSPLPLEDQEFLIKETKGFSGAEIIEFVRKACYEPMREAQKSKTFKICGEFYQICDATDPEAKEMSLLDIPPEQLKLRNVLRGDFEKALSQIEPSATELENHSTSPPKTVRIGVYSYYFLDSHQNLNRNAPIEKYKNKIILDVEQDIILSKPKISFSDIVGLEHAKRVLKENIILPSRYPYLFVGKYRSTFGIWLYGPSGTGKRLLVQACANEVDAPFFVLEAEDLLLMGPKRASQKLKKTFAAAKAAAPSVIYFDDIVSLLSRADQTPEYHQIAWRDFQVEYLTGIYALGESHVKILATSQKPWSLDNVVRRRTGKRIYVPLPEESARKELINKQLNNSGFAPLTLEDQEFLIKETKGFSASEIIEFVRRACYEPVREAQQSKTFKLCGESYQVCDETDPETTEMSLLDIPPELLKLRDVTRGDFEKVLGQIEPSTNELEVWKYEDFTEDFGSMG